MRKEASRKQFAIVGTCNTTAPVQLAQRPSPPARKPFNIPTVSAKQIQEEDEESSKPISLPQHLKSRPTTRTSVQTSEEFSKSSFQQYILATADYMRTSSEPFSVTSGSPVGSHVQNQTPSRQMPLRVQSLPNFSIYLGEGAHDNDPQTGEDHLEQQGDVDSDMYGSQTALDDTVTKKQLKLEVDLRVATTGLTSTDTLNESVPTEIVKSEATDVPASSNEVPSVNIVESLSPSHSSYPHAAVHQHKDDQGITFVHSDGICWTNKPYAAIPCVDSSSLAVSDTASQSSSTLTLKDDDASRPQPYSESLYDDQSTADRSLLYEQDDSLISSVNRETYVGSSSLGSSVNIDTGTLLKVQPEWYPNLTSEENTNIFSSGSPGHLIYSSNTATSARLTTNVGSEFTPASQLSHDVLCTYPDFLSIPMLKETSTSAPTILNTAESTTDTPDRYVSPRHSSQLPQSDDISQVDENNLNDYDTTPVLTNQLVYNEYPLEHDSKMEDTPIPDIQHGVSDTVDVASLPMEQNNSESSTSSLPQQTEVFTILQEQGGDIDESLAEDLGVSGARLKEDSAEITLHPEDDLEPPTDLNLTDDSKVVPLETIPLIMTHSGQLQSEGDQFLGMSETQAKVCKTLSTDKVMEKLLNNQTTDVPPQSLAVSLMYVVLT